MAVDMFLKVDGIEGESQDEKHAKEIDVLAWSWGMSQSGTMHTGGGGGGGKVAVQDVSVTKYVDASSNGLMQACCKGKHIPNVLLTVRKAGGDPLEYIKLTMQECHRSRYFDRWKRRRRSSDGERDFQLREVQVRLYAAEAGRHGGCGQGVQLGHRFERRDVTVAAQIDF